MNVEEDFNDIYYAHAPKVYRLCLGYANGDEERAKDWQQQTFIKVWKHRKSFKGESSIGTWIYRIAINTCLGDLRKSSKTQLNYDDAVMSAPNNSEQELKETQLTKMYDCINRLSKKNKSIILLELEEIPQATIAETLGLAHGTLRTRLSRIRNALLKCIQNGK